MNRWGIAAVALFAVGCKKKHELPANVPYELHVEFAHKDKQFERFIENPARGGTVYRNGKPFATVDSSDRRDLVKFTLPKSELPSTWGTLELGVPTPCGERRLPLSVWGAPAGQDERNWLGATVSLGNGTAQMTATAPADQLSVQTVRIEWGSKPGTQPLYIGALKVDPGTAAVTLHDPGCKPDIALKLGDQEFGKLDSGTGDAFIIADLDGCFTEQLVSYGDSSGAPKLRKPPFYERDTLDYYLTPPPSTLQVGAKTDRTYRTSVQRAACSDMPGEEHAAAPPDSPF